jgi:hypothetical protein
MPVRKEEYLISFSAYPECRVSAAKTKNHEANEAIISVYVHGLRVFVADYEYSR